MPSPAANELLQALHECCHYKQDLSFNNTIIKGVGLDLGQFMVGQILKRDVHELSDMVK
jgi:hypothetical protein